MPDMSVKDVPDNEIDALTGCRSNYGLVLDLTLAILDAGRAKGGLYRASFLCIDIDNFQQFLDYNGYAASDGVLMEIAHRLHSAYPRAKIYRHGGDEFVVAGLDSLYPIVSEGLDVSLKYSVVDVELRVSGERHHRDTSWVLLHIHEGVVKSTLEGSYIACRDRD